VRGPLRTLAWASALPLTAVVLFLGFLALTDYRPAAAVALEVRNNPPRLLERREPLSLLTFNIGYCGMDTASDFFMDGGRGSRAAGREAVYDNLRAIASFLAGEGAGIVLLQEVDLRSSRSHRVDQRAALEAVLPGQAGVFAVNYKVAWVPVPLLRPMGAVHGGLLTFSRFHLRGALRLQLPGRESWPRQLAELDRCLCECRLPLRSGGELVVLHLHLSVFDRGGRVRRRQLEFLRGRLLAERRAGHHVIAGGDWNHGLPGSDPGRFPRTAKIPAWYRELPPGFAPAGFRWAVDPSRPTIRASSTPYRPGESFVAVIDGFLVSDHVGVARGEVRALGFRHSDHNPVAARIVLL